MNEYEFYILRHKSGHYFERQNQYLGAAMMTNNLDNAEKMTLEVAESQFEKMKEKEFWEIWGLKQAYVLAGKSTRHLDAQRIKELEQELAILRNKT